MTQVFVNNFRTTVSSTFGSGDTFLQLTSVTGLPVLGVDEFFKLTVFRQTGVAESGHEVVDVTSWTGLQCTVVRAVEGAAASTFAAGSIVEARVTKLSLEAKADASAMTTALALKANAAATTTALAAKADSSAMTTALALKADVTYVLAQIAAFVDSAPGVLDTLNELAAALGDDPNFATTMATSLAGKLDLTGGTLTGPLVLDADPTTAMQAATRQYVLANGTNLATLHANALSF